MTETAILTERRGSALWARLNRPRALNAITPQTIDGLNAALDLAEADADIRTLVIAAAGPVYCAGADLAEIRSAGEGDGLEGFLADVGALFTRIELSPVPVIAAVQGLAVAGGLELVLACDVAIVARSGKFGDGHANYGLLPGGGGTVRLPHRVGPATARKLMFTAEVVPAVDLAHTDLVTELVDDDQLVARVDTLTETIAAKSALGIAEMKRLIADGRRLPAEVALAAELEAVSAHTETADFAEGLAAFAEKRRPKFTGS